jgi:hypothetical protein
MNDKENQQINVNIGLDPLKTPVYLANATLISTDEHTLTLSFLQVHPAIPNQQQIISRVALSRDQAKEFAKNLEDHIQKFEL